MKFLGAQTGWVIVLALLCHIGCTTPNYADPKGFSSTYFEQIYPREIFRPESTQPAAGKSQQYSEVPTPLLNPGSNPGPVPADSSKLPWDPAEELDLHAPRLDSGEADQGDQPFADEAELPGESAFLSPRWSFN